MKVVICRDEGENEEKGFAEKNVGEREINGLVFLRKRSKTYKS